MLFRSRIKVFQFHDGTIKSHFQRSDALLLFHFNSTMVRLKGRKTKESRCISIFQFHDGTIKSLSAKAQNALVDSIFQFHDGTIKRFVVMSAAAELFNFNSTMVRLKGYSECCFGAGLRYFNSTMVRLKVDPVAGSGTTLIFQFHDGTIKSELLL